MAFAYLQLNDDISILTTVFVYCFMVVVIIISFYLAKVIKSNIKKQELNSILQDINILNQKLQNTEDSKKQLGINNKIEILQREYQRVSNG